jgi:hypothetical protein
MLPNNNVHLVTYPFRSQAMRVFFKNWAVIAEEVNLTAGEDPHLQESACTWKQRVTRVASLFLATLGRRAV